MTVTNYTEFDDSTPPEQRDIPGNIRRYHIEFTADTYKAVILPLDIKVCSIENKTDKDIDFYVLKSDGTNHNLALDLHTEGTSPLIETVVSGGSFPVVQHNEFNAFVLKMNASETGTATGFVYFRPGQGHANGPTRTGLGNGFEENGLGEIS